jgi:hypothetical protein
MTGLETEGDQGTGFGARSWGGFGLIGYCLAFLSCLFAAYERGVYSEMCRDGRSRRELREVFYVFNKPDAIKARDKSGTIRGEEV